ncbi:menaquinone biosynthesis decarboxylase, putative [Geotalea daltonii FRC-32]|uniref:Flavin prenyltransferase UbiX n=1 Tax=Geotalea daltonii (strain DSM 22248 / JCM 15807 / FRC-32) TaxID=316067 RepID=B9LZ56_GEODF|nr:flavin prenyltransferase UbiX [Geotalea daltonii]ACM18788.1 menaquinone biosynthesis decarboxylase, putative [Geotalea daltonii FRC-32]
MSIRRFTLAITGASGAFYGLRTAEEILKSGAHLTLLVTRAGFAVLKEECSLNWHGNPAQIRDMICGHFNVDPVKLAYHAEDDLYAPIASGSAAAHAMIVAPCSMGSLSRIAGGNSGNLIERCADVMLKEKKPLILVPRETPLNEIHLKNMLKLARMHAAIIPAMPAFYHHPRSINDMVDFVVGRVLDMAGVEHDLFCRWGQPERDDR